MKKGFFITGTDTDVGKTWVAVSLMRYFKSQGLSVIAMKPVAAGCEWLDGELKNKDALLLQENASISLSYKQVNPYAFEMPVSPHLAAMNNSVQIEKIVNAFKQIKDKAEVMVVEGAGGWLAPLSDDCDIADLARELQLPVIVVVAIRLGCINHARLTFKAIQDAGVSCAGWVAMCVDSTMELQDQNIKTIEKKIAAPLLAVLPFQQQQNFETLTLKLIEKKLI